MPSASLTGRPIDVKVDGMGTLYGPGNTLEASKIPIACTSDIKDDPQANAGTILPFRFAQFPPKLSISHTFTVGSLIEVATEYWSQCMGIKHPLRNLAPEKQSSTAFTTDLPLLPMPKCLQTPKRAREDTTVPAAGETYVFVQNLPAGTKRGDLEELFKPYEP